MFLVCGDTMEKDKVLKIKDDVACRRSFDGTLVAVSPESDKVVTLNESAAELWSLIDGKRTVKEIIVLFAARFEVETLDEFSVIENDVIEIVEKFLEKQLVEII